MVHRKFTPAFSQFENGSTGKGTELGERKRGILLLRDHRVNVNAFPPPKGAIEKMKLALMLAIDVALGEDGGRFL